MNYTHTRKVTLLKAPGISGNFLIKGAISTEYDDFTAADDGQLFPIIVQDFASNYIVYANCTYTHATRTLTRGTLVETNSNTPLNLSKYANITVTGDDQSLGNADAVARGKIDSILKKAADTVPAGGQSLVLRDDGTTALYSNPTAAAITVPTPTTDASLLAAGLTAPAATGGKPGSILGSNATFAGLPKTAADGSAGVAGDYAVLTAQDGALAAGLYKLNAALNYVFDSSIASSSTTDVVVLASLPADSPTAIPASTKVPSPQSVTVFDSAGNNITDRIVVTKTSLTSSRSWTNLQVYLEA